MSISLFVPVAQATGCDGKYAEAHCVGYVILEMPCIKRLATSN